MSVPTPVRYIFTNTTDKDIFLSGVNITIKAHQSVTFTPIEIDDIEEYYDNPDVKAGRITIEIVGLPSGSDKYTIVYGTSVFTEGETFKDVLFVSELSLPYSVSLVANDNVNVFYSDKTSTGFRINISAAPGEGETINVDYIVVKQNNS